MLHSRDHPLQPSEKKRTTAEAVRLMLHPGEALHLVNTVAIPMSTLVKMGQPDLREVVLDCRDAGLRTRTMALRWRCLAVIYPQDTSTHIPRPKTTHFAPKLNTDTTLANLTHDTAICEMRLKEEFDRTKPGKDVRISRKRNVFGVVMLRGVGLYPPPDGKPVPSPSRPVGVVKAQIITILRRTNSTPNIHTTTHS